MGECRSCGCTDEEPCEGGCQWVGPLLCSKCIPSDLDYRCRQCGHEFQVKVRGDASIVVDGEEVGRFLLVDCPDCGSNSTVDTELEEVFGNDGP